MSSVPKPWKENEFYPSLALVRILPLAQADKPDVGTWLGLSHALAQLSHTRAIREQYSRHLQE